MSGNDPVFPHGIEGGLTKQELLEFILFAIAVTERGDIRLKKEFPNVDITAEEAIQVCLSSSKVIAEKYFGPKFTENMNDEIAENLRKTPEKKATPRSN